MRQPSSLQRTGVRFTPQVLHALILSVFRSVRTMALEKMITPFIKGSEPTANIGVVRRPSSLRRTGVRLPPQALHALILNVFRSVRTIALERIIAQCSKGSEPTANIGVVQRPSANPRASWRSYSYNASMQISPLVHKGCFNHQGPIRRPGPREWRLYHKVLRWCAPA